MLQSLVITLREGVEAALVIGIILAYLRKTGRRGWNRIVYMALAAAIFSSLIGAVIVDRLQVSEEVYEGWLLLVGAGFVFSMVWWMWRTGSRLKGDIEGRMEKIAHKEREKGGRAATLFLFVYLMVLREGIETVLFLAAVSLETGKLLQFTGGILGLGLAVVLGVGFVKGSFKVNLPRFFRITTVILLVVGFQLLVGSVHELSEAGVVPSGPRLMSIVGPLVNHDSFFFLIIVGLSLILLGAEAWNRRKAPEVDLSRLAAPERRMHLAERGRHRFWLVTGSATTVTILILISAEFVYSLSNRSLTPPQELTLRAGSVEVPLASLEQGTLKRYRVGIDGGEVRFLLIRDARDKVRVALDACLICGSQGYYQDGANVICANCAAAVYIPSIGLEGGCNPIAVDSRIEDGRVILSETTLRSALRHFR